MGWESRLLVLRSEVRAVHIYDVLPAAVGLLLQNFQELSFVCHAGIGFGLGHCGEAVMPHVIGQITPPFQDVGVDLETNGVGLEESSPEGADGSAALLRRQ